MYVEPSLVFAFIQAVVTGFSVLGGFMAAESGLRAARARSKGSSKSALGDEINVGIAAGFLVGAPTGLIAFTLTLVIL